MTLHLSLPTHVIVGDEHATQIYVESLLKKKFCLTGQEDCFCKECRKTLSHQHEATTWISPRKEYTLDDIAIVFNTTMFSLDENKVHFFIFEKAHLLTQATSNKLLKTLEEPPTGYHFVFLTNNIHKLLPTIISRSQIITLAHANKITEHHPLLQFFITKQPPENVIAFEKTLDDLELSDSASIELLNELIAYYMYKHKEKTNLAEYARIQRILNALLGFLQTPPQSGSSTIFWKNIWLTIHQS